MVNVPTLLMLTRPQLEFVTTKKLHETKYSKELLKEKNQPWVGSMGSNFIWFVMKKGELLNFSLTKGNVADKNQDVLNVLTKDLFGKLFADKGYISQKLFETLFNDGVHLVTGIKSNMKNSLMSVRDKILLRKRSIIETINDELKNICHVEHSRHRSTHNFIMNIVMLVAYCFFQRNLLLILNEKIHLNYHLDFKILIPNSGY